MAYSADVGIIVALPHECAAVKAVFDAEETAVPKKDDPNYYYMSDLPTNRGATYRIVIAQCPGMGNDGAATTATHLIRTYKAKHIIMVGIGAGVPNLNAPEKHVRLGDIVVSFGKGVVQYDMKKWLHDGSEEPLSTITLPSRVLTGAANALKTEFIRKGQAPWNAYIEKHSTLAPRPSSETDKLFICVGKKKPCWVQHSHPNDEIRVNPQIHHGLIGSGNCVMKYCKERDRLANKHGILCIEMEGAGIAKASWDQTQVSDYLVVRGICDYADRKKNDIWQPYAALAAASYTRALLECQPFPARTRREKRTTQQELQQPNDGFTKELKDYLTWVQETTRTIEYRGPNTTYSFPISKTFIHLDLVEFVDVMDEKNIHAAKHGRTFDLFDLWPESDKGAKKDLELKPISSKDILRRYSHVVLIGTAGSGKSTILDYFAHVLAKSAEKKDDEAAKLFGISGETAIPAIVPLNSYAEFLRRDKTQNEQETTLLKFLAQYPSERQVYLNLPDDFFQRLLLNGRHSLIVMLDGLDEITDETMRIRVSREIDDLIKTPYNLKCIVTTRETAYHESILLSARFKVLRLKPLEPDAIKLMIYKLCSAMPGDPCELNIREQSLSSTILKLEEKRQAHGIGRLVETPLMVRIIMTVNLFKKQLDQQRSEVIRQYIDAVLVATYSPDPHVAQRLSLTAGEITTQRSLLSRLAFEIHSRENIEEVALSESEVRNLVDKHVLDIPTEQNPKVVVNRFMQAVKDRGGIFRSSGEKYTFTHSAFREFLTGQYLAMQYIGPEAIVEFFVQNERLWSPKWREPLVHCIEIVCNAKPQRLRFLIELLLSALEDAKHILNRSEYFCLSAIGEACIECKMSIAITKKISAHVVDLLFESKETAIDVKQRAALGDMLGVLGDPRTELDVHDPILLPITGGAFKMGYPKDETLVDIPSLQSGQYKVKVNDFRIGKYPVTNAQFCEFINSGGYDESGRKYWTDAGWAWRISHGIMFPAYWKDSLWCIENHPVVGVSWFEAVAYCHWLTDKTKRLFRLPTEAEWERAAGTTIWPWGNEFSTLRANVIEEGIGRTTCVGLFPMGASSIGTHDVAGNVWEWCNSEYRNYEPYTDTDGRESIQSTYPRCIRGGSWLNSKDRARNANRDHYSPGDRHFDLGFRLAEGPLR